MSDPTKDDDLTAMYLTDKKDGIVRELDDHEELEVLLESFSKQVEEIVNEAENIEVIRKNHACDVYLISAFPRAMFSLRKRSWSLY